MTNEPEPNTRAGEALKPCPMCGLKCAITLQQIDPKVGNPWRISCNACFLSTGQFIHEAEAITAWNTRPLPQPSELANAKTFTHEELARIYRRAQLTAEEKLCREQANSEGLKRRTKVLEAQIAKLQADGDKLAGAATALRDDMLMRAEMHKHRNNGELVVESGNGVWRRINAALTEWKDRA